MDFPIGAGLGIAEKGTVPSQTKCDKQHEGTTKEDRRTTDYILHKWRNHQILISKVLSPTNYFDLPRTAPTALPYSSTLLLTIPTQSNPQILLVRSIISSKQVSARLLLAGCPKSLLC